MEMKRIKTWKFVCTTHRNPSIYLSTTRNNLGAGAAGRTKPMQKCLRLQIFNYDSITEFGFFFSFSWLCLVPSNNSRWDYSPQPLLCHYAIRRYTIGTIYHRIGSPIHNFHHINIPHQYQSTFIKWKWKKKPQKIFCKFE